MFVSPEEQEGGGSKKAKDPFNLRPVDLKPDEYTQADIINDMVNKIVNSKDGEFDVWSGDKEIGHIRVKKENDKLTMTNDKVGVIRGSFKMIDNGVEFYGLTGDVSKQTSIEVFPMDYVRVTLDVKGNRRGKGKGRIKVDADTPWFLPGKFTYK